MLIELVAANDDHVRDYFAGVCPAWTGLNPAKPVLFVDINALHDEHTRLVVEHIECLKIVLGSLPHVQLVFTEVSSEKGLFNSLMNGRYTPLHEIVPRVCDTISMAPLASLPRSEIIRSYAESHALHTYIALEPEGDDADGKSNWILTYARARGLTAAKANELVELVTRREIGYPRL